MNAATFIFLWTVFVGIFWREAVAVQAVCLFCVLRTQRGTSSIVNSRCDGFQMQGIYAKWVFTKMIDLKILFYRSVKPPIRVLMSVTTAAMRKLTVILISTTCTRGGPYPTFAGLFNFYPEPFRHSDGITSFKAVCQ